MTHEEKSKLIQLAVAEIRQAMGYFALGMPRSDQDLHYACDHLRLAAEFLDRAAPQGKIQKANK